MGYPYEPQRRHRRRTATRRRLRLERPRSGWLPALIVVTAVLLVSILIGLWLGTA